MSSQQSPFGHQQDDHNMNDAQTIQQKVPSENIVAKLLEGQSYEKIQELDPQNQRLLPPFNVIVQNLPKFDDAVKIQADLQKWESLQLMYLDIEKAQDIFHTKVYQEATETRKAEWWMQASKTLMQEYMDYRTNMENKLIARYEAQDNEVQTLKLQLQSLQEQCKRNNMVPESIPLADSVIKKVFQNLSPIIDIKKLNPQELLDYKNQQIDINFEEIISQLKIRPKDLFRFLTDPYFKQDTIEIFFQKQKLTANRKEWQRPKDRNVRMDRNFIDAHLKKLDQKDGGIQEQIKKLRRQYQHKIQLKWVEDEWEKKIYHEEFLHQQISDNHISKKKKFCAICLANSDSIKDHLNHVYTCHFWMLGEKAHPSTRINIPIEYENAFVCDGSMQPLWPEQVFWQIGDFSGNIKMLQLDEDERKNLGYKSQRQWQKYQVNLIIEQILEKNVYSSTAKKRQKATKLEAMMSRMNFRSMEPFFNEICETYWIQTDGQEQLPSITELAALYFDVDEMEAIAYLLGPDNYGTECYLDKDQYKDIDNERYPKPQVELQNEHDCDLLYPFVEKLDKKNKPYFVAIPYNFTLIPAEFANTVKKQKNARRRRYKIKGQDSDVVESDDPDEQQYKIDFRESSISVKGDILKSKYAQFGETPFQQQNRLKRERNAVSHGKNILKAESNIFKEEARPKKNKNQNKNDVEVEIKPEIMKIFKPTDREKRARQRNQSFNQIKNNQNDDDEMVQYSVEEKEQTSKIGLGMSKNQELKLIVDQKIGDSKYVDTAIRVMYEKSVEYFNDLKAQASKQGFQINEAEINEMCAKEVLKNKDTFLNLSIEEQKKLLTSFNNKVQTYDNELQRQKLQADPQKHQKIFQRHTEQFERNRQRKELIQLLSSRMESANLQQQQLISQKDQTNAAGVQTNELDVIMQRISNQIIDEKNKGKFGDNNEILLSEEEQKSEKNGADELYGVDSQGGYLNEGNGMESNRIQFVSSAHQKEVNDNAGVQTGQKIQNQSIENIQPGSNILEYQNNLQNKDKIIGDSQQNNLTGADPPTHQQHLQTSQKLSPGAQGVHPGLEIALSSESSNIYAQKKSKKSDGKNGVQEEEDQIVEKNGASLTNNFTRIDPPGEQQIKQISQKQSQSTQGVHPGQNNQNIVVSYQQQPEQNVEMNKKNGVQEEDQNQKTGGSQQNNLTRTDPPGEQQAKQPSQKHSQSAQGVQTRGIINKFQGTQEQQPEQNEEMNEKNGVQEEVHDQKNGTSYQNNLTGIDPPISQQHLQTSQNHFQYAQGVQTSGIHSYPNQTQKQQPEQDVEMQSEIQKEQINVDQKDGASQRNNPVGMDPATHQQHMKTSQKHSPDTQGVHPGFNNQYIVQQQEQQHIQKSGMQFQFDYQKYELQKKNVHQVFQINKMEESKFGTPILEVQKGMDPGTTPFGQQQLPTNVTTNPGVQTIVENANVRPATTVSEDIDILLSNQPNLSTYQNMQTPKYDIDTEMQQAKKELNQNYQSDEEMD